MTKYRLKLVGYVCPHGFGGKPHPHFSVIGENYDTRKQAENAKRGYAFARSGVVAEAKLMAERLKMRSPWRIEEYEA